MFDADKDGFLNKDELIRFFTLFYRFVLLGKLTDNPGNLSSQTVGGKQKKNGTNRPPQRLDHQYALSIVKRIFKKAKVSPYPGISLQYFSSLSKSDF